MPVLTVLLLLPAGSVRMSFLCFINHSRIINMKGSTLTVRAIDKGYEFDTTAANLHELDDMIKAIPALVSVFEMGNG